MKKILVVGGVAGGASFAARMRRLDETAQIILFEKGGYISFANCGLPYHIGQTIINRDNLIIQTPEKFHQRFNIDIRIHSEVTAIDTSKKSVAVRADGSTYEETYDYLLLSPGAAPIRPPIPGIDNKNIMTLRTIPDMDKIKERVDSQSIKRAVVIGGGFIGLEMAENLRHRGLDVTMVEMMDQVFAPADPEMAQIIHQHLLLNSVGLVLKDGAESFESKNDGTVAIKLKSGNSLNADLVILAIGVRPDTAFVREAGIKVNERGAIVVDEHLRTSADDVFAVGDAIEVTDFMSLKKAHIPLAGPANRQARIVADIIAGHNSTYKNTQGTAICKVFDLTAAVTGLNEKNAKRDKVAYLKSYTHSASHATYYPGSFPLSIKLLFAPESGKILGAQVIGKYGVDKRIDILSIAVRHGLTVTELTELELSYAPPYGSAKDPVNIAGFVAENILHGKMKPWYPEDMETEVVQKESVILDVRTPAEYEQGAIENATLIPIDELRGRLGELDKKKEINVYCQIGLRGYLATRILDQAGFEAKNLSGGYKTYSTLSKGSSEAEYLKPVIEPSCSSPAESIPEKKKVIDACGLQCPGPIMQLKNAMDTASISEVFEIRATDQGFAADIPSWCSRTHNSLLSLQNENGVFKAVVRKGPAADICTIPTDKSTQKTIVVFSNEFDRMMAAFIIANGAVSMGSEVTLFFTFWGLSLLRQDQNKKVNKTMMEKMFGMMMPKGAAKTKLSKMNMAGMGTVMIQRVMKSKNVYSLPTLIKEAQKNGIRFVACSMSMDIMGIKKEELIDGVEIGGVASYLETADNAGYNLFI